MQIHELTQGSDEWSQFRLTRFGASEAAAMLGISKKVKRSELLHMKKTGTPKEFSDWVQKNILDYGHEVEALARPLVEKIIGEDLYPVTCSDGVLSASCDGLTMAEDIAFEHKQWAEALAASVSAGVLPDEHQPQCQQIMMVTGAEKVIFTVSDGTPENLVYMEVFPDAEWQKRIRAGWEQFAKDLETYVPTVAEPEAVGRTPESLPALRIEVTGMVTASNLDQFKTHALAVFGGINRDLSTDQQFADAEKTVKWCADIEERLKAAKQHALSQTEDIDALFRTIDEITAEARATRLELNGLVDARKKQIRIDIQQDGVTTLAKHIESLNTRLGKPLMPIIHADFAGVMKGKRTIDSLRDAVATELARAKIAANEIADRIQTNLNTLRELAKDHAFLFADTPQIVLKPCDDLTSLVKLRIAEHKEAEERRLAAERTRIAEEERVKAEAIARAEADRVLKEKQDAFDAQMREEREQATIAARRTAVLEAAQQQRTADTAPITEVRGVVTPKAATSSAPTLKLGEICARISPLSISADGLRQLGFEPAGRERSAVLYHESDWPSMRAAMAAHIGHADEHQKQAA